MKIAVFLVGDLHDRGFNASALIGADRVSRLPDVAVEIVGGIAFDPTAMDPALRDVAERCDGVIFVGGQGNSVMPPVAASHPETAFAVIQGDVTGPNLASYDVLQEQSAFLAGCLAARMTQSGVVGHLSGHRVKPGLKGRAAFVAGARHVSPNVEVLTGFCGTQDDISVTRQWAEAQIAAGVDILFTMLNGARQGAIDACGASGIRQIGNALDWCAVEPAIFLASAIARIDRAVEKAAADMIAGHCPPRIEHLGLSDGRWVDLTLALDVPAKVAAQITSIRADIERGDILVSTTYEGTEFMI